jgi:hypothetical protein
MTLCRPFSGSKPQRGEDRIGGGSLGLTPDPFLHAGKTLGGLMDVVAVGDVGERREQLFETLATAENRAAGRMAAAAPRCAYDRLQLVDLIHPSAFFRAIPAATQIRPVAG